jgi:hypothetical protein
MELGEGDEDDTDDDDEYSGIAQEEEEEAEEIEEDNLSRYEIWAVEEARKVCLIYPGLVMAELERMLGDAENPEGDRFHIRGDSFKIELLMALYWDLITLLK